MGKMYNNDSLDYKKWTTTRLKREAVFYHRLINSELIAYGKRDLLMYDNILAELFRRGYQVVLSPAVQKIKR